MNKTQIISSFVALSLLILPAVSLANTYQYVNTTGNLQNVQAADATTALATAPNLAVHSGVMQITAGTPVVNGENTYPNANSFYQFIDVNGTVQSINAVSVASALTAPGIAPHSGVILVTTNTQLK